MANSLRKNDKFSMFTTNTENMEYAKMRQFVACLPFAEKEKQHKHLITASK